MEMAWGDIFVIPTVRVRKVRLRSPRDLAKVTGLGNRLQSQDSNPGSEVLSTPQGATFAQGLKEANKASEMCAPGLISLCKWAFGFCFFCFPLLPPPGIPDLPEAVPQSAETA